MNQLPADDRRPLLATALHLAGVLDALTERGDWAQAAAVEREIANLLPPALAACGIGTDGGVAAADAATRPGDTDVAALRELACFYERSMARLVAARAEVQRERDRLRQGFRKAGTYLQVAAAR